MPNSAINSPLQAMANGVLGKYLYDFKFSLDVFKFYKARFEKEQHRKQLINHNLYKKLPK